MIQPHIDDKVANQTFPEGIAHVEMPSGKNYLRTTTNY